MNHELKTWPQYFCRVIDGTKTFEVRNNDRGFQPGDTVNLCEWNPTMHEVDDGVSGYYKTEIGYTGRSLEFTIGYVFVVDAERVVFSLLPKGAEESE